MFSVPATLFIFRWLPRQAKKAALENHIWTTTRQVNAVLPGKVSYIIDGGFLLHLLTWCHGSMYNQIVLSYTDFLIQMYGKGTVIFFGYSCGPTTKDAAYLWRSRRGDVACDISFHGDMLLCEPKEHFLGNENNKQ